MKCLLKLLVFSVLALILVIGAGIALVDPMVKAAVSEGVAYTTQQETSLDSADVGLFSGELSLEGLEIANPPGFQETPLLRIGKFQTVIDTTATSGERIELDLLQLKDLELALELKGTESNVTQLIERLGRIQKQLREKAPTSVEGSSPDTPGSTQPSASGPTVGIKRIEISGVKASLRISSVPGIDGVYPLEMPAVILEDFDSSMDQATMVEWTAHVLEQLLTSALTAGEGQFPDQWQGILAQGLSNDALMSGDLKGVSDELTKRAADELDEILQGAREDPAKQLGESLKKLDKNADALKDLLGGKKVD
jgi:hypothetical protein